MNKDKKNRSGSISNENKQNGRGGAKQKGQPGAPQKSNRQTGDHEKDDSKGAAKNTTKKGQNSI